MATATKRRPVSNESVKLREACELVGVTRAVLSQMIELGYFTDRRQNPLSDKSNRRIYTDEIDRYLELADKQLPRDRVLAAMLQFRSECDPPRYRKK